MDPAFLKENYGDDFVFWGGGVDPQGTLAFGTPEDVAREVARNLDIFKKGGGYVFNNVHNIQANVPLQNLMAMFETFDRNRAYG